MSWPVSSSSTGKAMSPVPVVCALLQLAMGGYNVCGVGSGVRRMVRERVGCANGCYGVDWFPMDTLGGRAGSAVGVSILGGGEGVFTGDSESAGAGGLWEITLGDAGGFSLGAGWVLCSGVEYGICEGLSRKISRMQVRNSKRSV